jgi:ferrous iron transport protein B
VDELTAIVEREMHADHATARAWATWVLLSVDDHAPDDLAGIPPGVRAAARRITRDAAEKGRNIDLEIIGARYQRVDAIVAETVQHRPSSKKTWTDRVDGVLTHRVFGVIVFLVVMLALFQALFSWSEPAIALVQDTVASLQNAVAGAMPAGPFTDLLTDGVIAGVGNVLAFVPQIGLLFLFIGLMEDVGYLARVAFVIDRVMGRVGLHGKSFVPDAVRLFLRVPAVMATRTLESRTDRMLTMAVLPLMSCSARPARLRAGDRDGVPARDARVRRGQRGGRHAARDVSAVGDGGADRGSGVAAHGAAGPAPDADARAAAVPPARDARAAAYHVAPGPVLPRRRGHDDPRADDHRLGGALVSRRLDVRTGTVPRVSQGGQAPIALSVGTVPHAAVGTVPLDTQGGQSPTPRGEQLRNSFGGRLGRFMEPVLQPLGFDWRIGVGILGAFTAREVFVSTMGIVFDIDNADEKSQPLARRAAIGETGGRQRPDDAADRRLADGVLRARLAVRQHAGRGPSRVGVVELARLHVRLPDGHGLRRGAGGLSRRALARLRRLARDDHL